MNNIQKAFKNKAKRGLRMASGGVTPGYVSSIPDMSAMRPPGMANTPAAPSPMLAGQRAAPMANNLASGSPAAPTGGPMPGQPVQSGGLAHQLGNQIAMGTAVAGLSNTDRAHLENPNNAKYGVAGPAPGSSAEASQMGQQLDIQKQLMSGLQAQGMADGGVAETPDQLMARMAAKYGGAPAPAAQAQAPAPVAPAPAPAPVAQAPKPAGGLFSNFNNLVQKHKAAIDAAGMADGGVANHMVYGDGPKGVDSVPAELAPGEGVIPAKMVDEYFGGPAKLEHLIESFTGKPTATRHGLRGQLHAAGGTGGVEEPKPELPATQLPSMVGDAAIAAKMYRPPEAPSMMQRASDGVGAAKDYVVDKVNSIRGKNTAPVAEPVPAAASAIEVPTSAGSGPRPTAAPAAPAEPFGISSIRDAMERQVNSSNPEATSRVLKEFDRTAGVAKDVHATPSSLPFDNEVRLRSADNRMQRVLGEATAPQAVPAAAAEVEAVTPAARGANWAQAGKTAGKAARGVLPAAGALIAPASVGIEAYLDKDKNQFLDDPAVPFGKKAQVMGRDYLTHGIGAAGAVVGGGLGSGVTPVLGTIAGAGLGYAGGSYVGGKIADQADNLLGDPMKGYVPAGKAVAPERAAHDKIMAGGQGNPLAPIPPEVKAQLVAERKARGLSAAREAGTAADADFIENKGPRSIRSGSISNQPNDPTFHRGTSATDATAMQAPDGGGYITNRAGKAMFVEGQKAPARDPSKTYDADGNDMTRTNGMKAQLAEMQKARFLSEATATNGAYHEGGKTGYAAMQAQDAVNLGNRNAATEEVKGRGLLAHYKATEALQSRQLQQQMMQMQIARLDANAKQNDDFEATQFLDKDNKPLVEERASFNRMKQYAMSELGLMHPGQFTRDQLLSLRKTHQMNQRAEKNNEGLTSWLAETSRGNKRTTTDNPALMGYSPVQPGVGGGWVKRNADGTQHYVSTLDGGGLFGTGDADARQTLLNMNPQGR